MVVAFAPKTNPPISDREAVVEVDTIDIGNKKLSSTDRTRAVKDALEDLEQHMDEKLR